MKLLFDSRLNLAAIALLPLIAVAAACSSGGTGENGAGRTPATAVVGQRVETAGGSYTDVSPQELRSMLDDKDFPLVNVHIPYEGEIDPTDAFIPFDEIEDQLGELPAKNAKIVLYCRSGNMSAAAAEDLVRLGYTDVWNLASGMIGWEAAGYELVHAEE